MNQSIKILSPSERAELHKMWAEAEKPLLSDLRAIGLHVSSAWSVNERHEKYIEALPILMRHFHREYPDRIREGIARALGGRKARKLTWDFLLEVYKKEKMRGTRDGIAASISMSATPSDIDTLIELIDDKAMGTSRIFFVANLTRSRKPQALEALLRNKDDADLYKEIGARMKRKKISQRLHS